MSTSLSPFKIFQRNPNAVTAKQVLEADPLMDGIKTHKLSENYVSTLKFIHEKKEAIEQAEETSEAMPATPANPSDNAKNTVAQPVASTAPKIAANASTISTEAATTAVATPSVISSSVAPTVAASSSHMVERMQRFKNRLQVERNSQSKSPFTDTTNFQRFVFETKPNSQSAPNPMLWAISDYLERIPVQKLEPAFRKTSLYESLGKVFEHQSSAIVKAQSFTLTLEPADGFEFCSGGCDLFVRDETPAIYKAVEEDDSFTLNIPRADRLAINDVTLSHALRKRGVSADSFSGWFEEDGFSCAVGISPIESFVQSQLLHLHHQSQRTFNQLRRLALHLQTHCPNLSPSLCMENTVQTQLYFEQFGETPNPSLYRLLECECLLESVISKTLYEVLCESPTTPLSHHQVVWPCEPMSLSMLRLLAGIAQTEEAQNTSLRLLAVFDQLIREPKNEEVARANLFCANDVAEARKIHQEIRTRFQTLDADLDKRGLR